MTQITVMLMLTVSILEVALSVSVEQATKEMVKYAEVCEYIVVSVRTIGIHFACDNICLQISMSVQLMTTTVMSMLIVPILLEVLSAPVRLALKEVAHFAEVSNIYLNSMKCLWIFYLFQT